MTYQISKPNKFTYTNAEQVVFNIARRMDPELIWKCYEVAGLTTNLPRYLNPLLRYQYLPFYQDHKGPPSKQLHKLMPLRKCYNLGQYQYLLPLPEERVDVAGVGLWPGRPLHSPFGSIRDPFVSRC